MSAVVSLLSDGGAVTSVLGALVAGLPAMGAAPLFVMAVILPEAIREGDGLKGPIVGVIVAALLAFALAPSRALVLAGVFVVSLSLMSALVVGIRSVWSRGSRQGEVPWILRKSTMQRDTGAAFVLVFLALVAWSVGIASDRPWLPAEDVTTAGGRTQTSYVLSEDAEALTIMRDADRAVIRIPVGGVTDRTLCSKESDDLRSVLSQLLWDRPDYPVCRDAEVDN